MIQMGGVWYPKWWCIFYLQPREGHTFAEASQYQWELHRISKTLTPPLQHATSENKSRTACFGKLRCRSCNIRFSAVRTSFFTNSCAATNKKLHCNIEKAALQESGTSLLLYCGFQAPMFRRPRLGPADRSTVRG